MENKKVSVQFNCSLNTATLLMALYGIIEGELEDSIISQDNFCWLLDELAMKAREYQEVLEHYGNDLTDLFKLIAEYERTRRVNGR